MKKTSITLLVAILLLAGCSPSTANLNPDERNLYDIQEDAGQKVQELTSFIENDALNNTTPDYLKINDTALETGKNIKNSLTSLNTLQLPEETTQIATNTKVVLESTKRVIDKISELAKKANEILSDHALDDSEKNELEEITKYTNGLKLRLENDIEKLDNLQAELSEIASKRE
jgi:hypothetical protein